MLANDGTKDEALFKPTQPREKWLKRRTTIKLRVRPLYHARFPHCTTLCQTREVQKRRFHTNCYFYWSNYGIPFFEAAYTGELYILVIAFLRHTQCRGGSRIFERGGSILGLQAKGGARGGPTLGPMLKSLHRGPKGGGIRAPWTPPPWIRYCNVTRTNCTYVTLQIVMDVLENK